MRPSLSKEALHVTDKSLQNRIDQAEKTCAEERWIHAGEQFIAIAGDLKASDPRSYAIAIVKAAACFECGSQHKDCAEAYMAAASEGYRNNSNPQETGELYARAASAYMKNHQYFQAGTAYRTAAKCFEKLSGTVSIEDAIPPLPMAASSFHMAGSCNDASTHAYIKADEVGWAAGSAWLAGVISLQTQYGNYPSIGTCDSLCRALLLTARGYKTLVPASLRNSLPLTEEERRDELNPLDFTLEQIENHFVGSHRETEAIKAAQIARGETRFKYESATHATIRKLRYKSNFYQDLFGELKRASNRREASECYVKIQEIEQQIAWESSSYLGWFGRSVWRLTCGYGENIARWTAVSFALFTVFTGLYYLGNLIKPVTSIVDYPYFSVITLTSLGYGDIQPNGALGKIVACLEIVTGLIMFGLLITFFSKRIVRD